jgi:hypothetical protein
MNSIWQWVAGCLGRRCRTGSLARWQRGTSLTGRALYAGSAAAPALSRSNGCTYASRERQSFWPIIARGPDVQAASNVIPDIISLTTGTNRRMMIIPCHVDHPSFGGFFKKFAFFVALCVLPRIFDNEWNPGVLFTMRFPTCCCSTCDARCPCHQSLEDETFGLTVLLYLDGPLAIFRDDCGVKSTVFLAHP